ncbi:MAG: hypothetical protein VXY93_11005, partial [Pseudomonadota bacterium]|nr:hypothetical protein [Pseudomonadota bacterium]
SLMVSINGVLQHPSDGHNARSYTLIANVVQFTAAPAVGDEIQVRHMGFAGATTGDVSGFYGRTGNVVLGPTDHITTGDITSRNINASGILTASSASFGGNVSIGGTLTYEDVTNIDSVGIVSARSGIRIPNNTGKLELGSSQQLDISINSGGDPQINTTTVLNLATTSFRLRNANASAYLMNADQGGGLYLYHNGGSPKLSTISKGIRVGTGVTIETNGQATFAGITTFTGHSQFHDYIRIGTPGGAGSNTGSIIGKSGTSYNRPASLTFNHGGSATLELGSAVAAAIIGTNSHGAQNKPIRFMTGMDIGTLTGGSIQMEIKNNAVNIFNDLDVDGHTNLDNVSIAGVTTTTDDIIIGADNKKLKLGVGEELQLYQAGNHSIIQHNGGHYLLLRSNSFGIMDAAGTKNIFTGFGDTHSSMYYNGSYKIRTQNTGAEIVGTI